MITYRKQSTKAVLSIFPVFCLLTFGIGNASAEISKVALPATGKATSAKDGDAGSTFAGNASWYGRGFEGKKTASGEIFRMGKCSAAHRLLHLVTKVLVENPQDGKSTVVRVNDRGPFAKGRVIDLSREAAIKTGIFNDGIGYLECTVIGSESAVH